MFIKIILLKNHYNIIVSQMMAVPYLRILIPIKALIMMIILLKETRKLAMLVGEPVAKI